MNLTKMDKQYYKFSLQSNSKICKLNLSIASAVRSQLLYACSSFILLISSF
jgi:hypothetical protein